LFLVAAPAGAQDLDSAARELARKITATTGRQDVTLSVRNSSSLSEAEAAQVGRVLETELRVRTQRPASERIAVNVTLSENVQSYLWVAQIQQDVVMLSVPRPRASAVASARVTIQKRLLWEQDKPILDAAMSDSLLVVLDPTSVSFYRERQLTQSLAIPNERPMPRDPRGHVVIERDSFRAFLPGMVCSGSSTPAPAMTCVQSVGPWPELFHRAASAAILLLRDSDGQATRCRRGWPDPHLRWNAAGSRPIERMGKRYSGGRERLRE
jgi:hypothetical protein